MFNDPELFPEKIRGMQAEIEFLQKQRKETLKKISSETQHLEQMSRHFKAVKEQKSELKSGRSIEGDLSRLDLEGRTENEQRNLLLARIN